MELQVYIILLRKTTDIFSGSSTFRKDVTNSSDVSVLFFRQQKTVKEAGLFYSVGLYGSW
jgi:hypothetical protein